MCGIWGIVNRADEDMARRAVESIRHRGPDDSGIYVTRDPVPAAFGSARLSIIDLSEAGHMPMHDDSGRYTIVYNGEVYNYQVLRRVLQEEYGCQFHSDTDTEVVLHAYMHWGSECLEHLRGMFAFAIWDSQEGALFAARDRLGIKPLVYVNNRSGGEPYFAFASEVRALLATGLAERTLNTNALHHYLSFYAVPAPHTMIRDVQALPAGHYLTYRNNTLRIEQYWSLPPYVPLTETPELIMARLRDLLEESILLRMIADVPVGSFLSGGIDSAAVVALMTQATGDRLRTFSIGFGAEGANLDERSAARTVAEHYGTDHTEVVVTGADVREQIERIIAAMDQPTGDGINTYLVSQAAGAVSKVALSGLGGDELFAGYPQFRLFQRADRAAATWQNLPVVLRKVAHAADRVGVIDRGLTWLEGDLLDRYQRVRVLFQPDVKRDLYADAFMHRLGAPQSARDYLEARHVHPAETDSIAQLTRLELQNYMAHTLLRDTDAMSMAHSLEVRVPLIDHKLVSYAARIPPELKIRGSQSKWIFTQAIADLLPAEVFQRPKRGFEMPVAAWMRTELRDVLEDVFSPDSLLARGLVDADAARAVYADFREGRAATYMYAWSLAVLELWMRQTLDA
ncbi:MAG: asparagine synthase (glutamine-hydrolyzing) [Anaerolineae bacterium]